MAPLHCVFNRHSVQILRRAQDGNEANPCHTERSEGSVLNVLMIPRHSVKDLFYWVRTRNRRPMPYRSNMLICVCLSSSSPMNRKQSWGLASMLWASQMLWNVSVSAFAFGLGSS